MMMSDFDLNELELAPPEVVRHAARDFAVALSETPQFRAYETAIERLNNDPQAQHALEALEKKQQALQAVLLLNAMSTDERADLERLRSAFLSQPAVTTFYQAQADLQIVCQASADWLSVAIGLNYAAACGSGCC
jgi:cell fate (sporulation/competence/biofilm development) regulator YlbF (YheA/YmcA/DUF963 family)